MGQQYSSSIISHKLSQSVNNYLGVNHGQQVIETADTADRGSKLPIQWVIYRVSLFELWDGTLLGNIFMAITTEAKLYTVLLRKKNDVDVLYVQLPSIKANLRDNGYTLTMTLFSNCTNNNTLQICMTMHVII